MYRRGRLLMCAAAVMLSACNDSTSPKEPGTETPPANVTLPPSRLTPLDGFDQFAAPGAPLPRRLVVVAQTESGTPAPGVAVVFTVTGGGGSIAPDTVRTDAKGVANSGPWVLGTAGPQTMTVQAESLSVTFTALALAPDLTPLAPPDTSGPATGNIVGRVAFLRADTVLLASVQETTSSPLLRAPPHANAATTMALSRDRSQVAFVNPSATDICVASIDGTQSRCAGLVGYHDLKGLAWSPDGHKLAFMGPTDVECWDWLIDCPSDASDAMILDTRAIGQGTSRPVFAYFDTVRSLTWSPDGKKLALAVSGGRVYTINPDGLGRQLIYYRTDGSVITGVRWSPDGKSLALTFSLAPCDGVCDVGIAVVPTDRTASRVLVRARAGASSLFFTSAWSPDGTALAYGVVDCSISSDPCRQDVYLVGTAGGGQSRLLLSNAELLGWWP